MGGSEEAILRDLYVARGWTLRKIAGFLGVSHELVRMRLEECDIPRRRGRPRKVLPLERVMGPMV